METKQFRNPNVNKDGKGEQEEEKREKILLLSRLGKTLNSE